MRTKIKLGLTEKLCKFWFLLVSFRRLGIYLRRVRINFTFNRSGVNLSKQGYRFNLSPVVAMRSCEIFSY